MSWRDYRFGSAWIIGPLVVLSTSLSSPVVGAQLEAHALNAVLAPGEPLVVEVVLRLPTLSTATATTSQSAVDLRILHRRLEARLMRAGETVTEFPLFGPDFSPEGSSSGLFKSVHIGVISRHKPESSSYVRFDHPGQYTLIVYDTADRDLPPSTGVPVSIRELKRDEKESYSLFRTISPAEMLTILMEQELTPTTTTVLHDVALQYPSTIYGKYATVSMALCDFKRSLKTHGNKGGQPTWDPIVERLEKASELFSWKHPLREAVVFRLAQSQAFAKRYAQARITASNLADHASNHKSRHMVGRLIVELNMLETKPSMTQESP